MQRYRHISRYQDCTFGKAEKWILWHFESVDNQCVYLYQNRSDFTGKEKDVETGYGYFGARYIDHELMTMWLSVDPMADKFPSISPYAYCAWNPIKLVDPDGREIDDYFSYDGKYLGRDNASTNNVRIIDEKVWNSLKKDSEGRIDHNVGNIVSRSFSDAFKKGMPENALLNVYQHYNPTKHKLENLDDGKGSFGMRSHFEPNKEPIILIRLKGNSSGIKVCDYADEIINLFVHEKAHIDQFQSLGHLKYQLLDYDLREQHAIKEQIIDPSWKHTRENYRQATINYGKKHGMSF